MATEVYNSDKGGVNLKDPHKLNDKSEKAEAYRALAMEKGGDPDKRMDEEYQTGKGFLSGEQFRRQEVFQGSIDKYDPEKKAFDEKGKVNKRDSLYLILVDFFRTCYEGEEKRNNLANKEALMALACLTEKGVNVDNIPANGSFKIEGATLSIATKTAAPGEMDWDVCEKVSLIKDQPTAVRMNIAN